MSGRLLKFAQWTAWTLERPTLSTPAHNALRPIVSRCEAAQVHSVLRLVIRFMANDPGHEDNQTSVVI